MSTYRAHPCDCGCSGYVGSVILDPTTRLAESPDCYECHHSWSSHYAEVVPVVDTRRKVYISGPMTGLPDLNFPAFEAAEEVILRAGRKPVSPHRAEINVLAEMSPTDKWQAYMKVDLLDLLRCDEVCVLDGWEDSKGAQLEVHVARQLGIPVAPLWTYRIDASTLRPAEVRASLDL